jgi:hypothetical protein
MERRRRVMPPVNLYLWDPLIRKGKNTDLKAVLDGAKCF